MPLRRKRKEETLCPADKQEDESHTPWRRVSPRKKSKKDQTTTLRETNSSNRRDSSAAYCRRNANYLQALLPDEVLVRLCCHASPSDLCRMSRTCRRLRTICKDDTLWKNLYERTYQLDRPVLRKEDGQFQFIELDDQTSPGFSWRSCFPLLHKAIHVSTDEGVLENLTVLGRKGYSSISRAVKEVRSSKSAAAIVLVHPGCYSEQVVINKHVSLLGVGRAPDKEVVLRHDGTILKFEGQGTSSVVAFMNLEVGSGDDSLHARSHCIEVGNDSVPTIHDCKMTSTNTGSAAVFVHGEGAKPRIFRSVIYDCENVGIYLTEGAQGLFEGNEIRNNRLAGVWVKSGANPIMKRNEVHEGRDAGFFIFDGGLGYYEENNVHRNRIAGIEVRTGANPTVVRCEIHHGSTGGVYVHGGGRGEFISNRIHSNTFAGIWVTSSSNPTIKDNEIYQGQQGGIYVFGDGRGLIEGNNIHGNALAGIQVRSNSNPIIRKNRIHHGLHGGIYIHESGLGLIENNEIYSNALAGIWITTGSAPILRQNRIHSGKQVGVYFYDKGCGTLEDNEIYNHKYSGIQIRSGSSPVILRNKIWGGKNGGVLIYNGGQGFLEGNEIFDNAMAGVWIKTESNPILRRNKIHDGHEGGICIFNNGKGLLEENDIFGNALTGVLISTSSFPVLRRNRIFEGGSSGVEITNGAGGVLEKNEIFNNRFDGISLATGVSPKMIDNHIHDNKMILNEAVEAGKCLYQVSGSICYPMHDFYQCHTCATSEELAICVNCIKSCHKGHDVQFIRRDRFFCDCGASATDIKCMLTNQADTLAGSSGRSKSQKRRTKQRCSKRKRQEIDSNQATTLVR